MAWVTPVTNRTSGARMTYIDMNRITGDVSYLYNYALDHGYEVEGDDVEKTEWTQNDIVSEAFWYQMQTVLNNVRAVLGLISTTYNPTNVYNVNSYENKILETYQHIIEPGDYELLQTRDSIQIQTENGVDLEAGII